MEALSEKQKELSDKDIEINQLRQVNIDQQDVINNQQVPTVNSPQQQNINLFDDIAMADVADVLKAGADWLPFGRVANHGPAPCKREGGGERGQGVPHRKTYQPPSRPGGAAPVALAPK